MEMVYTCPSMSVHVYPFSEMAKKCKWSDLPVIHASYPAKQEGFWRKWNKNASNFLATPIVNQMFSTSQAMGVDRGQVVAIGKPGKSGQVLRSFCFSHL